MQSIPEFTELSSKEGMEILHDDPFGAVGTLPITGGRETLFWQTIHRKPMTVGINFTSNRRFRQFLDEGMRLEEDDNFKRHMVTIAKTRGVRYLIVNLDPKIRPDQYFGFINSLRNNFTPLAEFEKEYSILRLY